MFPDLISVEGKGIILGNPLRYLDCHAAMDIKQIRRSYNEIVHIRLKNRYNYIPENDPFKSFDEIKINKDNAQKAMNLLNNPQNLVIAKMFYFQINNNSIIVISKLVKRDFAKIVEYLKSISNINVKKIYIITSYARLIKGCLNNKLAHDTLVEYLDYLSFIINGSSSNNKINSDVEFDIQAVRNLAWQNMAYDYFYHTYHISADNIEDAQIMQRAFENMMIENEQSIVLNKSMSALFRAKLEGNINDINNNLEAVQEQIERYDYKQYNNAISDDIVEEVTNIAKPGLLLHRLYEDRFIEIKYGLQNIGTTLRNISININNKYSEYNSAIKIINIALEFASDDYLINKFREDLLIFEDNYNMAKKVNLPTPFHRAARSIMQSVSSHPVITFYGIIILIALIFGFFENDNSKSNSSYYSPYTNENKQSYLNRRQYGAHNGVSPDNNIIAVEDNIEIRSLEFIINQNKERLSSIENRLYNIDSILTYKGREIENIESSLKHYSEMISSGNYEYYSKYDSLYLIYEDKINFYNRNVHTGQELINEYDYLLDSTNKLMDAYNNYDRR